MKKHPLTEKDLELVEAAKSFIDKHFREDWHHIAVALRTKAGNIYTSFNLDTYVGGIAICAEPIAVGKALTAEDREIETVVAVRKPRPNKQDQVMRVVSPCGSCRELICDYAPECFIILEEDGEYSKYRTTDLLPEKYYVGKPKLPNR
jgi:cytidine deaminase